MARLLIKAFEKVKAENFKLKNVLFATLQPSCPRRPERPQHQHGLKEETHSPRKIGVQAKGIDPVNKLIDIPRKDRHKE